MNVNIVFKFSCTPLRGQCPKNGVYMLAFVGEFSDPCSKIRVESECGTKEYKAHLVQNGLKIGHICIQLSQGVFVRLEYKIGTVLCY